MQIGVATQINKVYLIGGSFDEHLNEISDLMMEWSLFDNSIRYKTKMPFKQFDFSTLSSTDLKIYCVGGCKNFNLSQSRP